jgi:hypothetical protein
MAKNLMRFMTRARGDEVMGILWQGYGPIWLTARIITRWGSNDGVCAPVWTEIKCKSPHMFASGEE